MNVMFLHFFLYTCVTCVRINDDDDDDDDDDDIRPVRVCGRRYYD